MEPPRRADAEDSRRRILLAARHLLAGDSDVHLNAVAKAAGVGQGTLYRHFPNRTALLAEVYRADIDRLAGSARVRLAHPDPVASLREWFDEVADYARVKHGVLAALSPDSGHALTAQHASRLAAAIDGLLEKGRDVGAVRPEVGSREVLLLLGFLARIEPREAEETIARTLDVIADGLRVVPRPPAGGSFRPASS